MPKVIGVDFEIRAPLLWNGALLKDGRHGAGWLTGTTIDTLVRVNVELIMLVVVGFEACGMNAIDRAYIDARAIFHPDTWLGNHIGHQFSLLSLVPQDKSNAWNRAHFPFLNCSATTSEIHPGAITDQSRFHGPDPSTGLLTLHISSRGSCLKRHSPEIVIDL
jgi:hypothetical protein